jgi:hypothetical protein
MADNSPLIDYRGGGSIVEWTKTLDRVTQELDFDAVIPGHGEITNKAGVRTYRDNIAKMRTQVSGMVKAGKDQAEVAKFMEANYKWPRNGIQQRWSIPGFMTELK